MELLNKTDSRDKDKEIERGEIYKDRKRDTI